MIEVRASNPNSAIALMLFALSAIGCHDRPRNTLISAIMADDKKLAAMTIENNSIDINEAFEGEEKATFLHLAAISKSDNSGMIELLLNKGAIIDSVDSKGRTPLLAATAIGNERIVRSLLSHGANPNICSLSHESPLLVSIVNRKRIPIEKMLLAAAANPDAADQNGNTALMLSAKNTIRESVELLISAHAKIDLANDNGETALHWACHVGDRGIVDLLLDSHANPESVDRFGVTPIFQSAAIGSVDCMREILKKGGNINASASKGYTPLIFAVRGHASEACIEFMLANGALKGTKDSSGKTATDWANEMNYHYSSLGDGKDQSISGK